MNQGEGQELELKLASLGHSISESAEDAEVVVVNTCVVIEATELKILKRMRKLEEEEKQLVVTGCMASVQGPRLMSEFPGALIIAPVTYGSFSERIANRFGEGEGKVERISRSAGVTFILPIAQGCLGHCSYCITRLARGRLKSYPLEELAELAQAAVNDGAREVMVTAQDTACYGKDTGSSLVELIGRLCCMEGDFRIRIGMMNPDSLRGLESDLAQCIKDEKVYKFLHLPVQTGSDRLLEAMGRGYSVEEFEEQVRVIRREVPRMTLSTDLICGFPGESERDHNESLELLRRVRPNIVNVTRFSSRPGTKAESMRSQVVSRIAKERSREIAKLRFEIAADLNAVRVGEHVEVMATEVGKAESTVSRDSAYVSVAIPVKIPLGIVTRVVITGSRPTHLIGRIVP
jgi:MiaB-like tRNA modifying enzyme